MSTGVADHSERAVSWHAAPLAELVRLAWPITVSSLSYATMTLADTLFVGWLGPSALAGVGLAAVAIWAVICFPFGLLRGAKVLVSQARGAGDLAAVGPVLGAALASVALLSALGWAVGWGVAQTLPALSATAAAGEVAVNYFTVRLLVLPGFLGGVALREVRYGLGDSRTPMVAALVANLVNIVLDYLLIFPAGLGVEGAAWATVIARYVETAILLVAQLRDGVGPRAPRRAELVALWRLGVPSGGQMVIEMAAFAVLTAMLSSWSEVDIGAHMVALQVLHFAFLPALSIGEAASVMAGEAVGARRDGLVLVVARLAVAVAGGYALACALVFVFGRHALAAAFTEEPALLAMAAQLFVVAAIFQIFDAINIVARCVLRGTGDVLVPAAIGVGVAWCATPPLTWVLGRVLHLGALGGWIGLCVEIVVGAGILWWRLERGGWRRAAAALRPPREELAPAAA